MLVVVFMYLVYMYYNTMMDYYTTTIEWGGIYLNIKINIQRKNRKLNMKKRLPL